MHGLKRNWDTLRSSIPNIRCGDSFGYVPAVDKAYLTDAANAQEVYGKLSFISDSQASDERLWAGMCLGPFYEYTQYRWK